MTRLRRNLLFTVAGAALLCVTGAAVVYTALQSSWLRERIRDRIVAETEKATGGRAVIGKFDFDWKTMHARVAPFVLRGKEKPGEPAFLTTDSIDVGLKVVSALKKDVDIASLIVDRPELHIIVYPDGSTNIPEPAVKRAGPNPIERFIRLAVQRFEIRNGMAHVRDEKLPLDVRGENLQLAFDYDSTGPRYKGHISSRKLHVNAKNVKDAAFDFDSDLALEQNRLVVSNAVFDMGRSKVRANGDLRDWSALAGDFDFTGKLDVNEIARVVPVGIERRGAADVKGRVELRSAGGFSFKIRGEANARGLAYRDARVSVAGIDARTKFELTKDEIVLPDIRATALGGSFDGEASLRKDFSRLHVDGRVRGVALNDVTRVVSRPTLAWSGAASGPVRIDGTLDHGRMRDLMVQATLDIQRAAGGIPIEGNVDVLFDQRANVVRLGSSTLSTDSTQIRASGTLGDTLRVSVHTDNLDDILPALALAGPDAPKELPVKLARGGSATTNAVVTGPLNDPAVAAKVSADNIVWEGRTVQHASADVTVSAHELTARNVEVRDAAGQVSGSGRVELSNWKVRDASALSADVTLRNAGLEQILAEAGRHDWKVTGAVHGAAQVRGTVQSPAAVFDITVDRPSGYGETLDRVRVKGAATSKSLDIESGLATMGRSQLDFTASYRPTGNDWKVGYVRFNAAGGGLMLDQLRHVREESPGLSGQLKLTASGEARVLKGDFDLLDLDSQFSISAMTLGTSPMGNVVLTARTEGSKLQARFDGVIRGSKIAGSGEWQLTGDYPGRAELRFSPLTFAALQEIAQRGNVEHELPFVGSLEGTAVVTGPLKKPDALRADLVMPKIEIGQNPTQPIKTGAAAQDLTIRNTGPVEIIATLKDATIRNARFAARDTNLQASGRVAWESKSSWDLAVRGQVNLAILQLFNADLIATGNATVDTTVRGALADPQIGGKLELKNASLYLRDITTGIDNANGVVSFDQHRANIDRMTAELGGGRVALGGFIGFSSGLLLYRVQGSADQVRLRHPDGASVTLNALLNLTGTSQSALVSGTITVMRAGFTPHTELGTLLAETAKPLSAPAAPNEYLRGLSFDVRVETGPSLQFQTSLARDLQAEAELRLRGNAANPILVGDVSVSRGEIEFFGNKYTINRGDVRFINPTKVEPVFDVDLETKARGITVNISFTGTLSKLNVTYRSDPPLQSSEIIALLAVGRDPTTSALAGAQTRTNLLQSGSSTLGTAVAAPVSSRLQRFFGVSRLKIDPQLTGVENIPQARLTLEQQVSRDITLTYITNLTRTQQQIIRVQWDINRQWSAIAIREENGVFGIDFQYRKRFR